MANYSEKNLIDINFFYSFFNDFYLQILLKKKKDNILLSLIKQNKSILYKVNLYFYCSFFLYFTIFISEMRWYIFFNRYKLFYKDYEFNFSEIHKQKLIEERARTFNQFIKWKPSKLKV